MAAPSVNDFQSCIQHCSRTKMEYVKMFSSVPRNFNIRCDGKEIFFLAPIPRVGNTLFSVTTDDDKHEWKKVSSPEGYRQLTRSEQLLRERMRASGQGITDYKYINNIDSLLVNTGTSCTLFSCQNDQVSSFPGLVGAIDYKLCPCDSNVLACVCEGDIWIMTSQSETPFQITNTKALRPQQKKMAGQSSFIIQEEFDRYTGYWWDPTSGSKSSVYRILYEEVDETNVEIVHTFNPSKQEMEEYHYPRPGGRNATTVFKCLQITLDSGKPLVEELVLAPEIAAYISQWEYVTRLGWMSDGKSFWMQLLDRVQHLSQLVLISADAFIKEGEESKAGVPCPILLWKETTDIWINVKHTSCFEFLPPTDDFSLRLVVVSEESDMFPHINLLEGNLPLPPPAVSTPIAQPVSANLNVTQVTTGEWCVLESKVYIDASEGIVLFEGNKSSCLDRHLYAVDLSGQLPCSDPVQLTPGGLYNNDLSISMENKLFVSSYSSQTSTPAVAVYSFANKPLEAQLLFHIYKGTELPPNYIPPVNFTTTATSGETLCGVVYQPLHLEEGKKYPTVLYVYGGPEFQVVKRDMSRFIMKISQWIHAGFAVVMLDNRGSSHRGKKFESYIQYDMGSVEVDDQVKGLKAAAECVPFIDTSRVAIIGWSYGGYMSLLGLAKRPDIFKVAVSGAPVTDMMWYDTGYTERYLGVPPTSQKAYTRSSVIALAPQFPNESGRLLILHGLNDENVLFTHTSLLLDALIQNGKPYEIQIFTGERHGIRNPVKSNHCDGTVLQFLLRNL